MAFPSYLLWGSMPIVLHLRHWPLTCAKPLAQLFLFCGIPFILVQQAFPVTCLVTLADCAWGQGVVVGYQHWGSNRACLGVHRNVCRGLSVSLATPRSVQGAASKLFWTLFLPSVCVIKCIWLSKKALWEEGWVDYTFCSYTKKGHSPWGEYGGITYLGSPVSKSRATLTGQKTGLLTYCIKG